MTQIPNEYIVPTRKKSRRGRIISSGIAAAAALLIALGYNIYVSYHRTLHLITGLAAPVTIAIDSEPPVTLNQSYPVPMPIAEGKHHVVLSGAVKDEFDIELKTGFFERFYASPAFVLNPGGARLLVFETTVYSKTPMNTSGHAPQYSFGVNFCCFPDVDYIFMPFPHTISLGSSATSVTRTRVGALDDKISYIVFDLLSQGNTNGAFTLAEWHLKLHPEDTRVLDAYSYMAMETTASAHALAFMKEGCKRRPIEIPWHLAYQRANAKDGDALEREYDALLQAEPDNSALLYLRAQLYADDAQADPLYARAIEKDPKNPWPHFALGHHRMGRADWAGARTELEQASQLSPENMDYKDVLYDVGFALGDYAALAQDLYARLKADPYNLDLNKHLCDVLIAQKKPKDAQALAAAYAAHMATEPDSLGLSDSLNEYVLYACGDFARLEKLAPQGTDLFFNALFEEGKLQELTTQYPLQSNTDWLWCLVMSAGWKAQAKDEQAKLWLNKSIEILGKGSRPAFRIAAVLRRAEAPSIDDVANLHLPPRQTAVIFAVLAQQFPAKAAEFKALGRRLNTDLAFPHHFLEKALAKDAERE